jgi:7-cyano-7-deazaguanine synthase
MGSGTQTGDPSRENLKALVLLSGGIDSAVCLWWTRQQGWDPLALTIDYHARPSAEVRSIRALLTAAKTPELITVPLPFLKEIDDLKKEGLQNPLLAKAPDPYIPSRNLIFYAVAGYYAETLGTPLIVGGHNGIDPETFPDSSPDFFVHVNSLYRLGLWSYPKSHVAIKLPLAGKPKEEVVTMGLKLGVPFEHTWSCYWDGVKHCGRCASCLERRDAFRGLGVRDPVAYAVD